MLYVIIELIWYIYDVVCYLFCMVFMYFSNNVLLMMYIKGIYNLLYIYI